jgi:hypothetical protein
MNPLISSSPNLFQRNTNLPTDVEMLQTDVMRFFAILCLCLMAIFALVKALPISSPADQPTIVEPTDLKAEAASLQEEIDALKEKLAKTQSELTAATAAVRKSIAQAADSAAIKQKNMSHLAKTRKELTIVAESLKKFRAEIKEREAMLASIVKDIDDKRRIRSQLKDQIDTETLNLKKIKVALARFTEKLQQSSQQEQQVSNKLEPPKVPSQLTKKGFTLRFASDSALQRLITRKKVLFFALAGKKAWQLKMASQRPVYIAVNIPPKIYEMETATVPAVYTAAFGRQIAAFGRDRVTWGVTLPDQTTTSIDRLIKDREGGDLVIMPDGEVILN